MTRYMIWLAHEGPDAAFEVEAPTMQRAVEIDAENYARVCKPGGWGDLDVYVIDADDWDRQPSWSPEMGDAAYSVERELWHERMMARARRYVTSVEVETVYHVTAERAPV